MSKPWTPEQRKLYAERNKTIPLRTFDGIVQKMIHHTNPELWGMFFFDENGIKYDLPQWTEEYDQELCSIIGRHVTKEVNDKIYNKIIVVSLRRKEEEQNDKGDDGHIHTV